MRKMIGVRIHMRARMTPASFLAVSRARSLEMFFGVISPKRMMSTVRTAVPMLTALAPKVEMITVVVRDEAEMLTTLLQMRTVDIILL